MDEHSRGRENATQLEERLRDYGVLFPSIRGHGFIVVGDDRIFIVDEESPNNIEDFRFRKIPFDAVDCFTVEEGEPDERYTDEEAERVEQPDASKPTTHIRLWVSGGAFDAYVDADPREVASAFVTFSLDEGDEGRRD